MTQSNQNPLVSIVVPVYNAERFIKTTIATVQAQTYGHFELIFIDDKSSDQSVTMIENAMASDPRIVLIKQNNNRGAPQARNTGTEYASGRFLAFLDADDFWDARKLERQVNFMIEKSSLFSFTNYVFTNQSGIPYGKVVQMPSHITYEQALKKSPIFTSTTMFDLKKVRKADLRMPSLTVGEDTLTWWNILRVYGGGDSIQETLAFYRRSEGTLSSNKIHAAYCRWKMYRDYEKLPLPRCIFYFLNYVRYAILRRI